jgi:hypothetical protein
MAKYSSERMSVMIELLGDLKVFVTFHLSSMEELVGYNEKFQPQKVVVNYERFWDFTFIEIFCILYVVHSFCMTKPHFNVSV